MKKMPFSQWRDAVLTWRVLFLGAKRGAEFANDCGFEDLRITDDDNALVMPFSSWERYIKDLDEGENERSIYRRKEYSSLTFSYVAAMRNRDETVAVDFAREILEGFLSRCPRPTLARLWGINIRELRNSLKG